MTDLKEFHDRLRRTPIIPGIKDRSHVQLALESKARIVFYISGTIFDLMEAAKAFRDRGVTLLAHIDLIDGIGRDRSGMEFLVKEIGVDGILSTRSNLLKTARDEGLLTIQRVFAVDSDALKSGVQVVRNTSPAALEILPGPFVPEIIELLPLKSLPPVIASGLIKTREAARRILSAQGIVSASTSNPGLWNWRPAAPQRMIESSG